MLTRIVRLCRSVARNLAGFATSDTQVPSIEEHPRLSPKQEQIARSVVRSPARYPHRHP